MYAMLDDAARVALVDEYTYDFAALLPRCAASDATIVVGGDLSAAQRQINYAAVARCAYTSHGAKPYWVPQQLDDVDVCGRKLGSTWHLPTEAEVRAYTEDDLATLRSTLTAPLSPGSGDGFPVSFYYSLRFYVRGDDGSLKVAALGADPTSVSAFVGPVGALYVGDGAPIGVRCRE